MVGNIISSTSSFDYSLSLSNSLFVSQEKKKKFEVVPISLVFSLSFSSPVERIQSVSPILGSPSVLGA